MAQYLVWVQILGTVQALELASSLKRRLSGTEGSGEDNEEGIEGESLDPEVEKRAEKTKTCQEPKGILDLHHLVNCPPDDESIADALYYSATMTLGILQKLGVAADVFNLWFQMLQQHFLGNNYLQKH
ncbi:hypothetical protein ACLOJK_023099 [Asimina triloba]